MIALTSLERSDSAQRSISWRIWARSLPLFFTGMIVSFISPWAVYAYCARHLLAVDGMVLQRSLFLSGVTTGGRSVQGILITIMMADPVHKRVRRSSQLLSGAQLIVTRYNFWVDLCSLILRYS